MYQCLRYSPMRIEYFQERANPIPWRHLRDSVKEENAPILVYAALLKEALFSIMENRFPQAVANLPERGLSELLFRIGPS